MRIKASGIRVRKLNRAVFTHFLFIIHICAFQSFAQDSIYLEAESGLVEAPMQVFDDPDASNGQYVEVLPGNESTGSPPAAGKVSFNINLKAGIYKIWGRVITPSGSDDSFWVQVNNGNAYRWNAIGEFNSWTWAPVHDSDDNERQVTWQLEEGTHTINIYYREDGAQLDEIYITGFDDTPTKGNVVVTKRIFVSQALGSDGNEGTEESPIRTLHRAYQIAQATQNEVTNYEILLRGGETFDDFTPIYGLDEAQGPLHFGFVWNINRKLKFSTYGPAEKAHLLGSKHRHEGGPTQGLLVIGPSEQDVLIENLFFEMWQEGAIMVYETEDVHIRDIKINKIGTYYFPGEQTPRNSSSYPYTAGVIYPKNSTRILMEHIEMTNCHNIFEDVTNLHGFYGTRLNESEIRNCYLKNVSGSPFKFRRSQANNVYIHDNEAYYTGHTEFEDSWAQPGFLRYSGDPGGDCPYALTFENNVFHYPFCWSEYGENCDTAEAILCSVSNTNSCGTEACTDPEKVSWINNDIIYSWAPGQQLDLPEAPFGLTAVSSSETAVTIRWYDRNINEQAFVIERQVGGSFEEVARLGANAEAFSEQNLEPATAYTYRVYVENTIGRSPYSESVTITTSTPNTPPVAILSATAEEGVPPLDIDFDGSASSDTDGDMLGYLWTINGESVGNEPLLSYTFESEGTYEVVLTVDDGEVSAEAWIEIVVLEPLSVERPGRNLVVFPNPSTGHFFVSSSNQRLDMKVIDLSGKQIQSFHHLKEGVSYQLPSGIYLLVFTIENQQYATRKLVVK